MWHEWITTHPPMWARGMGPPVSPGGSDADSDGLAVADLTGEAAVPDRAVGDRVGEHLAGHEGLVRAYRRHHLVRGLHRHAAPVGDSSEEPPGGTACRRPRAA